ncbi:MAG TPA: radical SAM protein [Bacteroidales bacterium]|nr:radical SAM protein [Bacteroidales bacterium]HQB21415.1 radical SAM protein [Bacteroidales bacterium]
MIFGKKKKLKKQYNSLREAKNYSRFCNAPFTSIRFHRNGGMQFCCHHIDYQFIQKKSVKNIWFSEYYEEFRKKMIKYDIPESCQFCGIPYFNEDYYNVNALSFDYLEPNKNGYPVLLDFSLENTCNLACIMCDTSLSSKLQAQKNFKPKSKDFSYDVNFLEQLVEFFPFVKHTIFTGGEPFLVNIYYEIWDKMFEINPDIIINITTNGTIYNKKIQNLLEKSKVNITVSMDSFNTDTYEKIRVGAIFDEAWNNVQQFSEQCKKKNRIFTITICPMIINAFEIPDIVNKCNSEQWNFNFNIVLKPWQQAIWSLSVEKIQEIIDYFRTYEFNENSEIAKSNIFRFQNLISLLEFWRLRLVEMRKNIKNDIEILELRGQIVNLIFQILGEVNEDLSRKVKEVIFKIPELLIDEKLLKHVEKMPKSMIINEFQDNDVDTIVDHLCIVAFNL